MEKEEGPCGEMRPFIYCPGQRIKLTPTSFPLELNLKNQTQALGSGLGGLGFLQGLHQLENEVPICSEPACYISKVSWVLKWYRNT